ncbi:endonuclease [Pleionea litopenaei]|uniref:Endonuclease n=1 Tax=Pleionea litopenaei TaxID=3070815 RepID=A0AA51X8S5_9GAMM|nr:endonuclease [Pleionea sp. HL-JVS1]WMS88405.1 endonuclease [Pleionea sp. HL-JVS1]
MNGFTFKKIFILIPVYLITSLSTTLTYAAPPSGYYDNINVSSGQSLHDSLHAIIDDHQRYPYSSSVTDTWDILEQADQDPSNSSRVIAIYENASYAKQGGGNSYYNREHSWPKSYGFPDDHPGNYPYTDTHHLFISNIDYNSARANKPFANCASSCEAWPTQANNGSGGSPSEQNLTSGDFTQGKWQAWSGRRGDVARALMYMAVRYDGGTHGQTGHSEPDLRLTDDLSLIASSSTGSNLSVAYMGLKSILLQWHQQDPVDDQERQRNDVIYSFQGNRNPFVDHPEFATCVFNNQCDHLGGGSEPPSPIQSIWINEIHYDNSGSDSNEAIEVAGTAGTNLSGWALVAYNGNGGKQYKTINLGGSIPNQSNGYGTLSFLASGLQNGSPDGIALVNNSGQVIQFLSYEGSFVATDGPANGETSVQLPVSETSSTPTGYSLQLTGSGQSYQDFTWQSPSFASFGNVNSQQQFTGSTPPTTPPLVYQDTNVYPLPDRVILYTDLDVQLNQASGQVTVAVDIDHTYRGDISLQLTSPGGEIFTLKSNNGQDGAQNINATYSVTYNSSSQGIWTLRVIDHYNGDSGQLNQWSLSF